MKKSWVVDQSKGSPTADPIPIFRLGSIVAAYGGMCRHNGARKGCRGTCLISLQPTLPASVVSKTRRTILGRGVARSVCRMTRRYAFPHGERSKDDRIKGVLADLFLTLGYRALLQTLASRRKKVHICGNCTGGGEKSGAGDGGRTRDIDLGKVALYH